MDILECLVSVMCQDAGIWYVFHSASTGDSHGQVPETKAELTPLGIFYNNRVHSNFKVSSHPPPPFHAISKVKAAWLGEGL